METTDKIYCSKHTNRETALRCAACGKPICVDCIVQTAVGYKCRECARGTRNPLTHVGPLHYLIGLAIGLGAGTIGALIGIQALLISFFAGAAMGGVIGEAIRRAVGRRYGLGLAVVAAIGIIGGVFLASMILSGGPAHFASAALRVMLRPAAWVYVFFALPAAWWRLR